MMITITDVQTIQNLGYATSFFVQEQDGWLCLKNHKGRCVFLDDTKCIIYEHKPKGCMLYPIVFDKDKIQAIYDKECPQKKSFPMTKSKVRKLVSLVSTLEHERMIRNKQEKTFQE